jgi:hypothetical protein
MSTSRRSRIVLPLISVLTVFALAAQAEEPNRPAAKEGQGRPAVQAPRPGPARAGQAPGHGPQDGRYARGGLPARNFGGHVYHGRQAWEGGRWRHEAHNGRYGWWWDVGGVWYFYPQPMEGPPGYISEVEVVEDFDGPDGPPVAAGYPPPPVAYAPPPPPPPPDRGRGRRRDRRWAVGRPYHRTTGRRDRRRNRWRHGRCHRRRPGCPASGLLSGAGQLLLPISFRTIRSGRSAKLLLKQLRNRCPSRCRQTCGCRSGGARVIADQRTRNGRTCASLPRHHSLP